MVKNSKNIKNCIKILQLHLIGNDIISMKIAFSVLTTCATGMVSHVFMAVLPPTWCTVDIVPKSLLSVHSLIEPGSGVLVECTQKGDTHKALADKLRPLMEMTPIERDEIGKRVRSKLQATHAEEIVFDRWDKTYT